MASISKQIFDFLTVSDLEEIDVPWVRGVEVEGLSMESTH